MQTMVNNITAMFTSRQLNVQAKSKSRSAEKLGSGYRINRAADDAAGLTISEDMRRQIRGLKRGGKNTQEGMSWLQVADGAMSEITSMVQRIRELAVQASNDTNTPEDRGALNSEISELRKEINKICLDTEFNTQDIFDNSYVTLDVEGTPNDLQIYNASYDDATGDVTYGGFIFHGNRIEWTEVDPDIVKIDPNTGRQVFNAGSYSYKDASGRQFSVICNEGEEPPIITREISISADDSGITIDGEHFGWSSLKDESERSFSPGNMHSGAWMLDYEGATVAFFVGSDIHSESDMARAINSRRDENVTYHWETKYVGTKDVKAVDASVVKNLQISNSLAQQLGTDPKLSYTVRAGKNPAGQNGIWLEKDGAEVTGSFKSWHELMGETDTSKDLWNSGDKISSDVQYVYNDNDGNNDTYLSFSFSLADVTSEDSVIDGLDGMVISGGKISNKYALNLNVTLDANVMKATAKSDKVITFQEELGLGRDFDQQEVDDVTDGNFTYDKNTGKTQLIFSNKNTSADVIVYNGNASGMETKLDEDLKTYLSYVARIKSADTLKGINTQDPAYQLGSNSLTAIVGSGNITTSGYFNDTVTIGSNMTLTDGKGWAEPGSVGQTYPTAFIDFKDLGTSYTLDSLEGLGFNSTCKTCNNHYSIMFVQGAKGNTTASGYNYNYKKHGNNYTLQIDIDSLKNKGVSSGADMSKAMVEITSQCFDFHYTQYAADGSKLYIYDNREQNSGTRDATFDTAPYVGIDTDIFQAEVSTDDGRKISLEYTYNFGDAMNNIATEMTANAANGAYVKMDDGTYEAYDDMDLDHQGRDRYDLKITYKDMNGNDVNNLSSAVDAYKDYAIDKMLGGSNIQLDAKDYTYMRINGNENSNVAVHPMYESIVTQVPYENGLHIQNSSQRGDAVVIPRFALNSVVLKLHMANVKTFEKAQKTIDYTDYALAFLNERRSMYGAYSNRLEHTYAANANTMENTQASESRIRDADMADEMVEYSKHKILEQAGHSLLAQANQGVQGMMTLLDGLR